MVIFFSVMASLNHDLWKCWRDCQRCKLHRSRTQIVFGAGPANPPIMFIGEAPGEQEDCQGLPFIGRAGAIVNRLIEQIGLRREDVYLTSLVKCRPPGNRDPEPDEVAACRPLLVAQIEALQPLTICTLGRYATQALLDTTAPISALRGKLSAFHGIPLMPTYHPAYLLRRPRAEREVREDLMHLQQTY